MGGQLTSSAGAGRSLYVDSGKRARVSQTHFLMRPGSVTVRNPDGKSAVHMLWTVPLVCALSSI